MLLNQFNACDINLNAQHIYGMTHFDVRLLETCLQGDVFYQHG